MKEPILEPFIRHFRFQKILSQIVPDSVVVDIGCGHTAHLLNRLQNYIKKGYGIDPLINDQTFPKFKLISQLLANKIPLPSKTADFVTMAAVLEHLENPEAILSEAHRILKSGGKLLLTTPSHPSKPILEFLSFGLGLVSTREIGEHKRYYWRKELVNLIRRAGFKKIKHEYFELYLNNFIIAEK